jgi:hypothetical protein
LVARIGENEANHMQSSDLDGVGGDEQEEVAGAMPLDLVFGNYKGEKISPPCEKQAGNTPTATTSVQAVQ